MAKTLTAQNIANISNIRFGTDADGNLTKIEVSCEVNYGTMGINQMVDLLPELTATQKTAAKAFYDSLKTKLGKVLLG